MIKKSKRRKYFKSRSRNKNRSRRVATNKEAT